MQISFTGSRDGMTPEQREVFISLLKDLSISRLIHGDCVGADAEAHDLVRGCHPGAFIEIWPGTIRKLRAFKPGDLIHEPQFPTERNIDIILSGDILLAFPREGSRGTWHTAISAWQRGRPRIIINEDGSLWRWR
jgi:hypothetical protein